METTNPNYNASSYDLVLPQSVLYWQRVMAANFLAATAPEWMRIASRHNSGTYNNMWMALDYKLFTPGRPLPDDTFWVGEQAPHWWHRLQTEYCMLHAPYLIPLPNCTFRS